MSPIELIEQKKHLSNELLLNNWFTAKINRANNRNDLEGEINEGILWSEIMERMEQESAGMD